MRLTCQERQERRSVSAAGVAGNGRAATLLLLHRLAIGMHCGATARRRLPGSRCVALGGRRRLMSCDSVSEYYPRNSLRAFSLYNCY